MFKHQWNCMRVYVYVMVWIVYVCVCVCMNACVWMRVKSEEPLCCMTCFIPFRGIREEKNGHYIDK